MEHRYVLNGDQIISEEWGEHLVLYLYDVDGSPVGMQYRHANYVAGDFDTYWFEKNLQGDIVAVYDEDGTQLVSYTYDAWGNFATTYHNGCTSTSTANYNPFRYRGYYYDVDLEMYYLQSRYYDPVIGRFLTADKLSTINASSFSLTDKNLFAYCDNNPVMRKDDGGMFWDTVFDVVSLAFSVAEVIANPADPLAWAGVIGDAVDLIPFVSGVGEVVRAVGSACKVVETVGAVSSIGSVIEEIATSGTPNEIGQIGEKLAGVDPKAKEKITINGRTRIPDKLTPEVLTEVKNVKYISNTLQLRDFADYAKQTGRTLELFVRPTTKVAQTVIDAGWVIRYLW